VEKVAAHAYPGRGGGLPPVLLIAMPKSGSIYIQRALSRSLRVPIQHVVAGGLWGSTFRDPDLRRFELGNVVAREHLQPRAFMLKAMAQHGITKAVLHVRDPRAAIVSWTKHMDRIMETRGFRSVELACEVDMPDAYKTWSFEQRLRWQVDHKLQSFVRWIEDWLVLVANSRDVEFLVTDYGALQRDGLKLITQILDFYGIAYAPDWIQMPSTQFGKNNIFTVLDQPSAGEAPPAKHPPSWATQMPPDVFEAANALVPASLCDRFGWVKT
jgi:hypothetical protein